MEKLPSDRDLTVTFYCKDPNSNFQNDCATFYRTDRYSWVVQGDKMGPEVAPKLTALADHETYLEISDALADRFVRMYARERYGVDLPDAP